MKTKKRTDKVSVITLGCSKNRVDSEVLLTQLRANNVDAEHETDKANIVVINTCGFIDRAKQESIQAILDYAEERKAGNIDRLFVMGCLSERYRNELAEEIPEVDGYFGTMDLPAILARFNADYKHELIGERLVTTPSHYAYLKISEGCNRKCSFCAIPIMRGAHRSREIDSLVAEAKFLVSRGVKELMLIAQDLSYYGIDVYGKRRLEDLLNALADVDGLRWIRLHYAYPAGFPFEILPVIRKRKNICNYLDIPLQHISDKMLAVMRRGLNKQKTIDLIARFRDEIPGLTLRTTMLVGHPGETEDDVQELLDFIETTRFDRLGVFTYSHEENTHSHSFEDDVDDETKQERADRVMEAQQRISFELNQEKIGRVLEVVVDRREGEFFVGRSEADSPEVDNEILISTRKKLRIGEFYEVVVYDAAEFDLFARPVGETQT